LALLKELDLICPKQVEWMISGVWNDQQMQKANIRMWPRKEAMWGYTCLWQIIIGYIARVQRDS
jgi:hypothetical protein